MPATPREQRRQLVAEATWRVILDRGIGAVSVRTVAAEAGMAVGSLRNLFPSQTELLEFSAEHMIRQATERVGALPPLADPAEHALAVIRELIPLNAQTRREFELNIALIAETPAQPTLAGIRDRAHDALLDLFTRIVATLAGGDVRDEPIRTQARRLLALVDGLGLHLLHQQAEADTEWAVSIIRDELARIRAGS